MAGLVSCAVLSGACNDNNDLDDIVGGEPTTEVVNGFAATPLLTNATDPQLINSWGVAEAGGLFWIADNGTGFVTVVDAQGVPSPQFNGRFNLGPGITGVVALDITLQQFLICNSSKNAPAQFVFASENGTLIAINEFSPPGGVVVVDRSKEGAVFKGVTFVNTPSGPVLLAADFANARIDIFDTNFHLISPATGAPAPFTDPLVPAGFGPFNVMALGNNVFVSYAQIGPGNDDVPGPGLGRVTMFDTAGNVVARMPSDLLNAPWGMALAQVSSPTSSGMTEASHDVLFVGNFGDGRITRFDLTTLQPIDQLMDLNGAPIVLDGLWGLVFGSAAAGNANVLYFAAGPADETAGEFGLIERVSETRVVPGTGSGSDTDDTGVDTSDTGGGVDTSDL